MQVRDLAPAENNPRTISPEMRRLLDESMAEFGDLSGIVFNRRSGRLIGGHQRTSVMPPEAEVVVSERFMLGEEANGTVGRGSITYRGQIWAYREVDWPPEKEKRANLAANRISGEFADDQLAELLREITALGGSLDLTGFSLDQIQALPDMFGFGVAPVPAQEAFVGLPQEDRAPFVQMTFALTDEQARMVREVLTRLQGLAQFSAYSGESGNNNSNGNALAIMAAYAGNWVGEMIEPR